MNLLTFARSPEGHYSVVDSNDEKLSIIAALLLDEHQRREAKKLVDSFDKLTENFHLLTAADAPLRVSFLKESSHHFTLEITDTTKPFDEANPLRIDLSAQQLKDLIESWHELTHDPENEELFMVRAQDDIYLTADGNSIEEEY